MNKNLAHDVNATTLQNAMLQLGASANDNVNSGVYKMNDVTNMTKAGQWAIQRPSMDRENVHTTISGKNLHSSPIIRSGRMILNNNFCGMYDFAYHNGNVDLNNTDWSGSQFGSTMFTGNTDTHWALIYINGNLELDFPNIIRPPVRKLGMVIYVTGNLIANGFISMTNRGANHSGTGTSHGYTAPVAIPLNGTLIIPAAGGAATAVCRSPSNSGGDTGDTAIPGVAAGGSGTATYCGSGGGASGMARIATANSPAGDVAAGAGSAGTCFTGGGGGAGVMVYNHDVNNARGWDDDNRHSAQPNGGAGGQPQGLGAGSQQTYGSAGGVGNPGGYRQRGNDEIIGHEYGEHVSDNSQLAIPGQARPVSAVDGANGTAGTCVVMCAGTYSGSGKLRSTGHTSYMYHDGTFGGAGGSGGGGVFISLYGTDSSSPTPTCAGGLVGNHYAGTNAGGAGTGLKAAL